jgi:putative oxidoreductase
MNAVIAQNPIFPLLSRILIGLLFVVAGLRKVMAIAATAGYFAKLGFPAPEAMAYLSVLIEIGGGLLLIIGFRTRVIAWLLVAFVVIATGMAHRFWEFADAAQYGAQLNNFMKNLAIIGGLLMVVTFGPGSASVDKR